MKIVLHIGLEKTGTTAIQRSLQDAREALAAEGVLYPENLGRHGHTHLTVAIGDCARTEDIRQRTRVVPDPAEKAGFAKRIFDEMASQVSASRPKVLVLSNEHLSSRLLESDEVAALREFLAPLADDIQVVVYLRRQDELFLSYYSQQVKARCGDRVETFGERPDWFDFEALLDRWALVFGSESLVVRTYPPEGGDLLSEFSGILGTQHVQLRRSERSNPALDHLNAALLADINRHMQSGNERQGNRAGLDQFMQMRSHGPRVEIGHDQRAALLSKYAESNETVRRRFFPDRGQLFSDEVPNIEVPAAPRYEDALGLILEIWSDRADQLKRIRMLEKSSVRGRLRRAKNSALKLKDKWWAG